MTTDRDYLGRLQWWLQGGPTKTRPYVVYRPWPVMWVGNRISDLRFWSWRLTGRE